MSVIQLLSTERLSTVERFSMSLCMFLVTPLASYPDPLHGGTPGYHKRLSQMAALLSETVHWERIRKAKKSKSNSSQKLL